MAEINITNVNDGPGPHLSFEPYVGIAAQEWPGGGKVPVVQIGFAHDSVRGAPWGWSSLADRLFPAQLLQPSSGRRTDVDRLDHRVPVDGNAANAIDSAADVLHGGLEIGLRLRGCLRPDYEDVHGFPQCARATCAACETIGSVDVAASCMAAMVSGDAGRARK